MRWTDGPLQAYEWLRAEPNEKKIGHGFRDEAALDGGDRR